MSIATHPNMGYDMLIGRDLLRTCLLVYDGETGEVGLELPSATHPLMKSPWAKTVVYPPSTSHKIVPRAVRKRKRQAEKTARKKNRKKSK